jgi:outer membrane protein assembly factor BamB
MDAERIYVPLENGALTVVDRQTGANVWQGAMDVTCPLTVEEGVLLAAGGTHLRALDAASGTLLWEVEVDRPLQGKPRLQDGLAVVLMDPDDVMAYRVTDGSLVWRRSTGGASGERQMTVGPDGVYLSAPQGHVIALSLVDGHPLWDTVIPGVLSAPAAGKDRVFVGSDDNFFYALSADSGRLAWRWRAGGDVVGSDADTDAAYFASLDNELRAVNRDNGNQRWQKDTGTRPVGPPRVAGPVVIVAGVAPTGMTISAFSVLTGAVVGTFTPPGAAEFEGEPLVDPRLLPFEVAAAVLTRDGRLFALRPIGMTFRETAPAPFVQLPGRRLDREPPPFAVPPAPAVVPEPAPIESPDNK